MLTVFFDATTPVLAALVAVGATLVMCHHENIFRLFRGEERKIGVGPD